MGTVSMSAQYYQLKVRTDDGLITPFNVDRVDSVYFEFVESDENGNDEDETTVTGNATDITTYTAKITSWANILDNLSTDLKVGIIYTPNGTPNKSNGTQITVSTSNLGSDAKYTINLTSLAPSTTYYYRSFVYQSGVWFYGNVKSFTTNGQDMISGEVSKLTCYSAKISGAISIDDNQYHSLSYGICYGTNSTPTVNNNKVQASGKDKDGNFTCQLRALTGSTTYYYRSYAYVDYYLSYGPIRSFTTKDDDVVITGDIDITTHTVQSTLKIGSGAYSTLVLGVCYGTNELPTIYDKTVTANEVDDENNFVLTLSSIPMGKVYYRSYVLIDNVAHYGEVKSFAGNSITTCDIDTETYSVKSHIGISKGYNKITFGVCYGTSETPTVDNQKVTTSIVDADNDYVLTLTSIPVGTVYYRSYVLIDDAVYYGEVKSFAGNSIITGDIDTVTYSVKSHIGFSNGYQNITFGVCYGSSETPTIDNQIVTTRKVDAGNDYVLTLTSIPFGIVYYRAYVLIGNVAYYGEVKSFAGNSIITCDIDTVTYSVKSHIGISKRYNNITFGVCYGTCETPTIDNQIVNTSSVDADNDYVLTLTKIPFGIVYYRSYVLIDNEAHYGEVKSFAGNSIITGDIDSKTYSVKSHIGSSKGYRDIIYGVCYGSIETPTVNNIKVTINNVDADNNYTLTLTSIPFGIAYYRSYVLIDNIAYYGEVKSFIGNNIPDVNGYEYVDLGLSVLWATCNVGATKPEEYGNHYSWGEISSKSEYGWENYSLCYNLGSDGSTEYIKLSKYNIRSERGTVDGKTTLELSDDVAHQKWGGNWRMPTQAEYSELLNKCTWGWTTENGVEGYKVTSKTYRDRFIFLPAAGANGSVNGPYSFYWSSSLCKSSPYYTAWALKFQSGSYDTQNCGRCAGYSVRPVCP